MKRKIVLEQLKNIAGQVLTYNSKEFPVTKQKLDLARTMSESGKPFLKKNQIKKAKKNPENQCQNAASENKKPLARNVNLILTKN